MIAYLLTIGPACGGASAGGVPALSSPSSKPSTAAPSASAGPAASAPAADRMARLQESSLRLDADELAALARNGFVVTDRKRQRTFADAWLAVYKADLPIFISADALLHALHRSYDAVLRTLEQQILAERLDAMLLGMRARLAAPESAPLAPETVGDADVLLTVALQLLENEPVAPLAPAREGTIAKLVERAQTADGLGEAVLFGKPRAIDWSQFRPRGHYTSAGPVTLSQTGKRGTLADYFRAIMWLGRTDLRIAEVHRGAYDLNHRQLDLALALRGLMGEAELSAWRSIEAAMNAWVGPRDGMAPDDVDRLLTDLGVATPGGVVRLPDAKLLQAVMAGHYGEQRILSQLAQGDPEHPGLTDRVFLLTGQRYTPDAHALSDLAYDRVGGRMMPDPLDVAVAVLGNTDAKPLLAQDVAAYTRPPAYGPALDREQAMFEAKPAAFWQASLYTLWLGALRALSPAAAMGLPGAIAPLAWGRRVMSSQLASWAELRHDSLLYAKQPYTSMALCSYPDALVDPYPAFYERLGRLAAKSRELVAALDLHDAVSLRQRIDGYFEGLGRVAARLGAIAEGQARGQAIAADDLAFVNGAVTEEPPGISCGPPPRVVRGWFADLYFDKDPLVFAPTIADVHTQPTDAFGNLVGNVLHVGTGQPRIVVVNGGERGRPHPYVGAVSMFAQRVVGDFQPMTDEEWLRQVSSANPDDVPWMRDVVVR